MLSAHLSPYSSIVLPLCEIRMKTIERLLFSILWFGRKSIVCREACVQHPCQGEGVLVMSDLECHQHSEKLVFLRPALT